MSVHPFFLTLTALSAYGPAPDFEAAALDGEKIKLSDLRLRGPIVLVLLRGLD